EKATKNQLLQLKKELEKSSVNDMLILSFAGHGVISEDLVWNFALHGFSSSFEDGFTFDDIEKLIDGIPARDRLILIDACHSGEIDREDLRLAGVSKVEFGDVHFRSFPDFGSQAGGKSNLGLENSFQVMKQLFVNFRNSTGSSVISSAGGVEFALENEDWKNGVFTYSFIEGITSKNADLNNNGVVRVSDIREYVINKVLSLTKGLQRPTMRNENLENDFIIWKY
ncbi:MAG: caspase family protein, partial [Bacteroidota bacterium]